MSLGGNAQKVFTTRTISASLTRPSDTTQYAAGDVISAVTSTNHYTFSEMVQERAGMIISANLHSSVLATALNLEADLVLFRTDITKVADNSPYAPTDAEAITAVGRITFPASGWCTGTVNQSCFVTGLNILFTDDGSSRALYGQLVTRNAYTPQSAEVFAVDLVVSQD